MVTLKEVAAAAQVSTVTASSVLSGVNRVRVSPATAERIHRIAKSMNYVPLAAARGLRTGKTRIIAFVASSHDMYRVDDAWHESLRGVSDLMWEREERLMLVMSRNREHELEIIRQMAYGRQVDGFIVQDAGENDGRIDLLIRSERPFVLMGGQPRPEVNSVSFDMRAFAAEVAALLQRKTNCNRILLIPPHRIDERVYEPFLKYFTEWERERNAVCEIWRGAFVPDAQWLAARRESLGGEKLGVALLRALLPEMVKSLTESGLALGKNSAMVYVSSGEDVLMSPDGLSIMHFDNYTLGRRSARLLLNLVDGGRDATTPENIIIPAAQKG